MKKNRKIMVGILLLTSAVFIGVSLASYDSRDWNSILKARNLCGPIGAVIGGALIFAFGTVLSWIVPLFLLFQAAVSFMKKAPASARRVIICAVTLLWTTFSLVAAAGNGEAGGYLASKTVALLSLAAGRIGSVLILSGGLLLSVLFLFFGSIRTFFDLFKRIRVPKPLWQRMSRRETATRVRQPRVARKVSAPKREAAGVQDCRAVTIAVHEPGGPRPSPKKTAKPVPVGSASVTGAERAPLPDLSFLEDHGAGIVSFSRDDLIARSEVIESKLLDYGLSGKVKEVHPGPVVTTFEFVPAPGVKVSQISSRADDISLALAARAIRIQAPIPGRGAVGIEVPNPEPQIVSLKEQMEHYPSGRDGLHAAFGKTATGEPYFANIADMPHLLIAGATGSGKSVCINAIICSLLFHHTPETCRFILVDPKRLELIAYNGIPHLLHPVITEAKQTLKILRWLTIEMDRRYELLASAGVKNIQSYNRKVIEEKIVVPGTGEHATVLPYYVTIIDELADIMVIMGNEIYPPITRLSQMARAVGIHLVFATQRPSVDVVTGLIKANFPCRIAFQVTSKTDSRTILDINGAEKLLGNGDMLYLPKNLSFPIRLQGSYISEREVERVASYWRTFIRDGDGLDLSEDAPEAFDGSADGDDELFDQAKGLVIIHQQGSISLIQRRLRVGYARAARLIDMLEQAGVVGPFEGSKARRVLVSREDYERR